MPPALLATILQAYTGVCDDEVIEATVMDKRLIGRVVALVQREKGFGPRQLRAALDSSPLWGAGRVEDTYNLMGHALRKALSVIARQQGRGLAEISREAGAGLVSASSLKAALALDRDAPEERQRGLGQLLLALEGVQEWLDSHPHPLAAHQATDYERQALAKRL